MSVFSVTPPGSKVPLFATLLLSGTEGAPPPLCSTWPEHLRAAPLSEEPFLIGYRQPRITPQVLRFVDHLMQVLPARPRGHPLPVLLLSSTEIALRMWGWIFIDRYTHREREPSRWLSTLFIRTHLSWTNVWTLLCCFVSFILHGHLP